MWHRTLAFNIWCTKTNPNIHNWCMVCDFQFPKTITYHFWDCPYAWIWACMFIHNLNFPPNINKQWKGLDMEHNLFNNHLLKIFCANLTPSRCYEMSPCSTRMNWKEWPFLKRQQMEWLLVSKTYFGGIPYWPSKMPLKRLVRNLWPSKTF